ncbi:MAG: replication-associated recombination protein A, partial [Chloroflexi bacterium]|nr:replication-associated recombination protein A [Chloroflexota bacterium]
GYGKGYKYAHNYDDGVVAQQHLPDKLAGKQYYRPSNRGYEKTIGERMEYLRLQQKTKKTE